LDFESAKLSVVKSIRQRDILNTWLRLYAGNQRLPRIEEYRPERLTEELPDLVYCTVDMTRDPAAPHHFEQRHAGVIRLRPCRRRSLLHDYLGPRFAAVVMPVYHHCLARALPVYTIARVADIHGHEVAYERLLLPFADSDVVTHAIASVKAICEDGGFEIKNLMRDTDELSQPKLRAVIDRDLFHRTSRAGAGEIIEFS
jgi:hypothetical protein